MSAYTTQYDSDFASQPLAGSFYSGYDLFKQAVVAIWTEAALILADSGSTSSQSRLAVEIMSGPTSNGAIGYAKNLLGAFLADSGIQAAPASASDSDVQAAAHWIFPILT